MEEKSNKSHVLVLPFPVQGHINPMVQFSKRLTSKESVKVTLITIDSVTKSMPILESGSIKIHSIPHNDETPPQSYDLFLEWFHVLVSKNFTKIVEELSDSEYPVKVLVFDSITTWAIDLAHDLGLKGAAFFTQSCALSVVYYHMDPEKNNICVFDDDGVCLPSLPLLQKQDLPSFVCQTDLYPSLKKLVFSRNINFKKADWLLFNSFDVLEKEVISWLRTQCRIKTIGPIIPSMYLDKRLKDDKEYGLSLFKPNSETCMKWLDSREIGSVVYVSFGSLANLGEQQMEELALGLMMSDFYFLWAVRATEENKLTEEFMSKSKEKCLIVNWCPQLDVLSHQAVGCFFTHCGWNSTLEALSLGVPMVAMPQWSDQPTNAKFISDVWQTGVRVKAGENGVVNRDEIASSIRRVMREEKGVMLKENAIKWKKLAKEAVDEGGSSDKNIEEFLKLVIN
ncbi:UDP-glycosyltransferase 74E2-like [Solanum pennellii]|uniref:Glycosyltransferase n=1 Tax=Solanum pennellii TaxID=28526 RepID=A0ABM1FP17_SOLPN|nr:UDP-glycosyltransferase 74E2-like [Solanum pennellii]